MADIPASDRADPVQNAIGYLDDLRAVLDGMRGLTGLAADDLPDIRAALLAAIYDGPPAEECLVCEALSGGMCAGHRARAQQCARWTELLHRLDGTA